LESGKKDIALTRQKAIVKEGFFFHNFPFTPLTFLVSPLLTALCLISFSMPAFAQQDLPSSASNLIASIDRNSAAIGSIVVLTLKYTLPEGTTLLSSPQSKGLEELTVLDKLETPGRITIRLLIDRLESWQTGELALEYLDKDGVERLLSTGPVSVSVLSNLGEKPEEAQLKPIQTIVPTASLWWKLQPWVIVLLALLLIGLILFWWFRIRGRKKGGNIYTEPYYLRAKREIHELEAQQLVETGNIKPFYFRFSEILRQYLEALRGFPAAEFTTEEIASHIAEDRDRDLLSLLRQADLIKFANDFTTTAKKEEEVRRALSYIQETAPVTEDSGDDRRRDKK